MERIVLIGMMGSGKSTIGRLLAARTGWRYVDNDDDVRALTDAEPAEVAAGLGEASLHAAEAAAFLRALSSDEPRVVGAAAWVILDPACRAALDRESHVVYLRARPETLHRRIGSGAGRRDDATDLTWLEQRAEEREDLYRRLASLVIDVDTRMPHEIVDLVVLELSG